MKRLQLIRVPLTCIAMLMLSPILSVLLILGFALLAVGEVVLRILAWPFVVLGRIADAILGGGSR